MIDRVETFLRTLRRLGSRSEWLRRLLKLPVSDGPATRTGLILIQVEGLSREAVAFALQNGKLPFLQRLLKREHYCLRTLYSGLPAITPAVQVELFYGMKTALPGFGSCDSASGRSGRLIDPAAIGAVERRLEESGDDALLSGGSTYASVFDGGSREAYFCPSKHAPGPALRATGPLALAFVLVGNCYSLLRAATSAAVEFMLVLTDSSRGVGRGRSLLRNLRSAPARAAVCVLMRELSVIGAKLDINRGLPIVFVNFRGYVAQARYRGPGSTPAQWALKGIDAAIARLWRAADRSPRRLYDVWIYSDHGCIEAQPYERQHDKNIEQAVAASLKKLNRDEGGLEFTVAAQGSAGLVCAREPLGNGELGLVARDLAAVQGVPLVVARDAEGKLRAWAGSDEFRLPEQFADLFGRDHPFLDQFGEDLPRLCRHAGAGEIAIFGWRKGAEPITFGFDNGSKGGLTARETAAFALLPEDISMGAPDANLVRPGDLRHAALRRLGRLRDETKRARARPGLTGTDRLRVMTYNVHGCFGMDGRLSVERIARVIARYRPDVVALQELDVGRRRSGGIDQAELIARHLEMNFHFHPTLHIEEERYGNAILTHLPMRLIKAAALPRPEGATGREPRGALWVALDHGGNEIQIINTHLGLSAHERLEQAEALCSDEWLAHEQCLAPAVLCGDLNASPASAAYRLLRTRLADVQTSVPQHRPRNTFVGRLPTLRIDHILIDPELRVAGIEVPRSALEQVASDHLPLIVDLLVAPRKPQR